MLIQGNIASKGLVIREVFRPQTSYTEGLEWLFPMVDGTRLILRRKPAISRTRCRPECERPVCRLPCHIVLSYNLHDRSIATAVMDQKCTARKDLGELRSVQSSPDCARIIAGFQLVNELNLTTHQSAWLFTDLGQGSGKWTARAQQRYSFSTSFRSRRTALLQITSVG
ncbi:hypothetical protein BDV09DRAFT_165383 [Aspergillus tetrazonus]